MAEKQTMFITVALVLVIVFAIGVMIYVNLPQESQNEIEQNKDSDTNSDQGNQSEEFPDAIILSLLYGDQEITFNLSALTEFETYTGYGRYIKTKFLPDSVILGDVYEYAGVSLQTLLGVLDDLPKNYTLNVTAGDGYITEYSKDESFGYVDIYNENGTIINGTAVMLLAFMENGSYYFEIDPDNEIGPLRIAFVGEHTRITSSALWSKKVISIEINEIP